MRFHFTAAISSMLPHTSLGKFFCYDARIIDRVHEDQKPRQSATTYQVGVWYMRILHPQAQSVKTIIYQKTSDEEATVSSHICNDIKQYQPKYFWNWRGRLVTVLTQRTEMISSEIMTSFQVPMPHKQPLETTQEAHDVLKLLFNKPHLATMKHSAAQLCLEVHVWNENDYAKTLYKKKLLWIIARATSLRLSLPIGTQRSYRTKPRTRNNAVWGWWAAARRILIGITVLLHACATNWGRLYITYLPLNTTFEVDGGDCTTCYVTARPRQSPFPRLKPHVRL